MTFTGLVYTFQIQRLNMTFPVLTLAELWYMCKRIFSHQCASSLECSVCPLLLTCLTQ